VCVCVCSYALVGLQHPFWEVFGEYFPVHVVKSNPASPPLPPQKAHIFAVHPHGVIGFGRMMLTSRRYGHSVLLSVVND